MANKRWVRVLACALLVDLVCAIILGLEEFQGLLHGRGDMAGLVAAASLLASLLVLCSAALVSVSLIRTRRDLHRSRQALAADESTSADWVWETDTQLRFTSSNDQVRLLLGYEPSDIIGTSALALLPPDQRPSAEALVQQAVEHRSGWLSTEFAWTHADGSHVKLKGRAAPIRDEAGRLIGFRGSRRPITSAERAERAVAAARGRVQAVLDEGALDIALQPIVHLSTGELAGAEALARFRDGRSPDVWFGEARDCGLSLELDRHAFVSALQHLPDLPAPAYLSVNATPELLLSGQLVMPLLDSDLPLERIVIEITEHSRIDEYGDVHLALAPLRERGIRLAIDDTGAGFASLTHVLKLRPDIIKIDRSLITSITSDPARRSLVTSLVLLALDLPATVTAEGIETPSELETLATLGVDLGQGYLFGRPNLDARVWRRWSTRHWPVPTAHADVTSRTV